MQQRLAADQIAAQKGHIPGLDGLRALSIAIVVFGHYFFSPEVGAFNGIGVDVFFAISGFLITRLLLIELKNRGEVNLPSFYLRRALRLFPALLTYLFVVVGVAYVAGLQIPIREVLSAIFYFTNYLVAYSRSVGLPDSDLPIGVLWSLSVEEHFYILAPLAIALLGRTPKRLLACALLVCAASLLIRCIYIFALPELVGKSVIYIRSETRFDAIAWGVAIAAICEMEIRKRAIETLSSPTVVILSILVLLTSYAIRDTAFRETVRFSVRSVCIVPLIVAVVFGTYPRIQGLLNSAGLVWLGKISYSLYLWHGGVHYILQAAGIEIQKGISGGILMSLIALSLAAISYHFIETPIISMRERFSQNVDHAQGTATAETR